MTDCQASCTIFNVLSENGFKFLTNKSTNDAFAKITNYIYNKIDNTTLAIVTFDTAILWNKLNIYKLEVGSLNCWRII